MSRQSLKRLVDGLTHLVLICAVVIALFPVFWILSTSFKPKPEVFSTELYLFPKTFTLDNYNYVMGLTTKISTREGSQEINLFVRWLTNSLIVAGATTIIGVVLAAGTAYAFSRFQFLGRRAALGSFLVTQMFPGAILLVPLYNLLNQLGLLNSWPGLVLAYCTTALPFSVWMLKSFFDTIPVDLEEAATVDGANPIGAFVRIILPLALPGIAVAAFYNFMTAWNEFLMALTFMTGEASQTLPVGLRRVVFQFATDWHYMSAGAVIVTVPVLIMFFLAQRYLISGLTAGGVKG